MKHSTKRFFFLVKKKTSILIILLLASDFSQTLIYKSIISRIEKVFFRWENKQERNKHQPSDIIIFYRF